MKSTSSKLYHEDHAADLCIVGAGMAGLCAALAAARHGARVVLMHDRTVPGGNASSENRVHICGADRYGAIPNLRETGILEEIRLENLRHNRNLNFSIWDTILYEKLRADPRIELLLNCSCLDAETSGDQIESVTGWQTTTQTHHRVSARIFVDCSGDAILAPLTKADFRIGREARSEFGEPIAPEEADSHTMGMTCLFQARPYDTPQPFEPPSWAYRFNSDEELPYGTGQHDWWGMGYWWVELGGDRNSIRDAEVLRDELLKIVFGIWDHIKNRGPHGAENWALDWVQFLPAKRESRRYVGDHMLTQLDIEAEGRFEDRVAYGGWPMDDHHPAGFNAVKLGKPATVFHPAPSPFGIPYRSLYSKNVANLMFAGRCASCTHAAMSSTRVMGTACSMGQAVGSAAALAIRRGLTPAQVASHVPELQQMLLRDDCYIPWMRQEFSDLTQRAKLSASQGDPEPLRDGINRPVGNDTHAWECRPGDWVAYHFPEPRPVSRAVLIMDSAMDKNIAMSHHQPPSEHRLVSVPPAMPRVFHIEGLVGGEWIGLARATDNYQRLVQIDVDRPLAGLRYTLDETWGAPSSRLYAFYIE